jgi:ThiF family
MQSALINRSPDLLRLRDEGFEVEVRSGHLLVHGIPYVNASGQVARGTLVSDMTLAGDATARPANHVAWFVGDHPCDRAGREITAIKHGTTTYQLAGDITAQHAFSNKPAAGYPDYHAKMTRYIEIISAPAQSKQPGITVRTYKPVPADVSESVFHYIDSASSRAGIAAVSAKLSHLRVGIVGLGGTGSYLLDLIAKTPVREIHLYDGDLFLQHNAFRAPSAASLDELHAQPTKVGYMAELYAKMRRGVVPHAVNIDAANVDELLQLDFVFLCMDSGPAKRLIIDTLQAAGRTFIDTGIGVELLPARLQLWGICRVTTSTAAQHDHVAQRVSCAGNEDDGLYARNIQVAELNALCAVMAVTKWKKLCGFYADDDQEHDSTYTTNTNLLTSDVTR